MEPLSFPSEGKQASPTLKTLETCKKIISSMSLPEENGWNDFQPLCFYKGFWWHPYFIERSLFAQENFKAQPRDIFICSSPKTGTTWLKALTFATLTRTHFKNSPSPLLSKVSHDCMPFMEIDCIENPFIPANDFPLCATHVPFSSLPKSVIDSGCKIIYICRDPKDSFVSLWHHTNKLRPKNNEKICLEEAFELYCNGKSPYGPYWEHVLGYWKASLENPDKLLFLKYEDMMRDTAFYLKKLGEFIGHPFSLEEEKEAAVEEVMRLCSFKHLSNLEVNKTEKSVFFRKGEVGDWISLLTLEMGERLDNIMEEKLSGSGLTFKS